MFSLHRAQRLIILVLVLFARSLCAAEPIDRAKLDEFFQSELAKIVAICEKHNRPREAQITRDWFVDEYTGRQFVYLPTGVDPHKPRPTDEFAKHWHVRFRGIREIYAQKLFELANDRLDQGDATRAFQLLHQVLRENPDHAKARAALPQIVSAKRPKVSFLKKDAHPRFGWKPYTRIESTHFRITTNDSAANGVDLARRLEQLHSAWEQVFFRYWSDAATLEHWMSDGRTLPRVMKRFQVVLFADRDEYQAAMTKFNPGVVETEGIYLDKAGAVWLYSSDDVVARETALHEVTHQLFHETTRHAANVGGDNNFWIVEGIAMYMQSMAARNDYATIGGFDSRRLQYARYWYKNQRFYLPLADLVALGTEDLQKHENIQRLYTQSAGLTHFLMNHNGGEFRDGVINYVREVYAGVQKLDSLQKSTAAFGKLDQLYEDYLAVTDEDLLQRLNPPENVTLLMLGGTDVTNEGLKAVANHDRLELLDVSATRVTDEGLANVVKLKNLTEIWLTQTGVTDAGLDYLRGLRKLERVEVTASKVTDAGMTKLKKQLPNLE